MVKFAPISLKDFELYNAISIEKYGEPVEFATVKIGGSNRTNPRCSNCGYHWNGHFSINDKYCPNCGGLIVEKPEPIKD